MSDALPACRIPKRSRTQRVARGVLALAALVGLLCGIAGVSERAPDPALAEFRPVAAAQTDPAALLSIFSLHSADPPLPSSVHCAFGLDNSSALSTHSAKNGCSWPRFRMKSRNGRLNTKNVRIGLQRSCASDASSAPLRSNWKRII